MATRPLRDLGWWEPHALQPVDQKGLAARRRTLALHRPRVHPWALRGAVRAAGCRAKAAPCKCTVGQQWSLVQLYSAVLPMLHSAGVKQRCRGRGTDRGGDVATYKYQGTSSYDRWQCLE